MNRVFYSCPREHLNESNQARNWSFETGDRGQEERGRSKEPEEVFLQI